jgi:hypothetical protein
MTTDHRDHNVHNPNSTRQMFVKDDCYIAKPEDGIKSHGQLLVLQKRASFRSHFLETYTTREHHEHPVVEYLSPIGPRRSLYWASAEDARGGTQELGDRRQVDTLILHVSGGTN